MRSKEIKILLNKHHNNIIPILGCDSKDIKLPARRKVSKYIYLLMDKAEMDLAYTFIIVLFMFNKILNK